MSTSGFAAGKAAGTPFDINRRIIVGAFGRAFEPTEMRLATRSGPLWPTNLAHLKGSLAQWYRRAKRAGVSGKEKAERGRRGERRWESGKPACGFPLFQGREAEAV